MILLGSVAVAAAVALALAFGARLGPEPGAGVLEVEHDDPSGGREPPAPGPPPDARVEEPPTVPVARGGWRSIPPAPIGGRYGHTATWTGTEMIVVGGSGRVGAATAAAYDPASQRWRELPEPPLSPRTGHTAVWTGARLLVWGGVPWQAVEDDPRPLADGAAYDPALDTWRPLGDAPISGRWGHTAVWTGDEMVVWGGRTRTGQPARVTADGAAYDPGTDAWRRLPDAPLTERWRHTAVWNGREVIVWGGESPGRALDDGARYLPWRDEWRAIEGTGLTGWTLHAAAWGVSEPCADRLCARMFVWGGSRISSDAAHLWAYDLEGGRWDRLPAAPLRSRPRAAAVWSDAGLLVWGGGVTARLQDDGARYDAATGRWERLPAAPIGGRTGHSAVWTGDELLVWGGLAAAGDAAAGATWRPSP